ncbi:MAG TPA: hypothetical protein VET90_00460 [Candidatus Binatus sp.]|nr:hypothetical protein [Candidatus Binatus sp.]
MGQRRRQDEGGPAVSEEAPSIRDAEAVARRVAEDEVAAVAARLRYRMSPQATLEPANRVRHLLGPGERVVAERHLAFFDRRRPAPGSAEAQGLPGALFITSARLIFIGRVTVAVALADIADVVMSAEQLLLTMRDGIGIALDVDRPRLLRVEISAARVAARS